MNNAFVEAFHFAKFRRDAVQISEGYQCSYLFLEKLNCSLTVRAEFLAVIHGSFLTCGNCFGCRQSLQLTCGIPHYRGAERLAPFTPHADFAFWTRGKGQSDTAIRRAAL
jgi:hypothetical protein